MNVRDAVFAVVGRIPPGKVLAYGQVADLVDGVRVTPLTVGRIMATADADAPWHRVMARDGELVIARRSPRLAELQKIRLLSEGVAFDGEGRVRMDLHTWHPGGTLFDDMEGD